MANVKKINGYDLIDNNFLKYSGTINNIELNTWSQWNMFINWDQIILPTGWDAKDVFVIEGYYEITDPEDPTYKVILPFGTQYDLNGDIYYTLDTTITITDNVEQLIVKFFNLATFLVGKNISYKVLLYHKV